MRDIRASGTIHRSGEPLPTPAWLPGSWYEKPKGQPSKEDFEAMLGYVAEEPKPPEKGEFTTENTLLEMAPYSVMIRLVIRIVAKTIAKANGGNMDETNTTYRMALASSVDSALFSLIITSGGAMPEKAALGLLDMANGHFFKGVGRMLKRGKLIEGGEA